jgi:glycosyltransferase involved in cell wall biosynthesis
MHKLEVKPTKQPKQSPIDTNSLKLVFLSQWGFNPYQKLLVKHLAKMGVQVQEVNYHTIFLPILLKQGKPNVVHLQSMYLFFLKPSRLMSLIKLVIFVSQLLILRMMGVKIVWTAHDLKNHSNRYLKIDRFGTTLVTWLVHAIIAHCDAAKREVITAFRLRNADKVFVVPHGNYIDYYENNIDRVKARKALNIPQSSPMFLFLGWIRGYKGVLEMIDTFKELQYDEAQLVIAGKPSPEQLDELIKQKIAGDQNIQFISGFVPDDQIQVYMNACDVVIFPYKDILTSGAVLLAMSFGKACIAPRKCCIAEVLDDSGAFLYDPDLQEGLSQAMNCAIQRQSNLLSMGEHNRQLAEQWTWSRVAEMTLKVYQQGLSH